MTTQQQVLGRVGLGSVLADGNYMPPALGRRGEAIVRDWLTQLALDGNLFYAQQGNAGTLVDFAEVAYDEDQPQFGLDVPSSKVVIPIRIAYNFQDQAGTDNHVILSVASGLLGAGTSTALSTLNMRTDQPKTSGCTARSLYTGNAAAVTNLFEFERWVDPFAAANGRPNARYVWDIRQAGNVPVVYGASGACLMSHIYATTDGPEGFGEIVWAEFDSGDIV